MALGGLAVAASSRQAQKQPENQPRYIDAYDLGLTHDMLSQIHGVLKHNYYDPSFHGLDIDARYQTYMARLDSAKDLLDAYRIIAAYLSGLDDPHTLFIPPPNSYRVTYGYRAQMIGDRCFVTDVRPGTDAAQKLHPGDQLVSLDGYAVNASDLYQLQYYLNLLAPKKITQLTLRDPQGNVRSVSVESKVKSGPRFVYWVVGNARMEMDTRQHLLRSRTVEQGSVLFWKLPALRANEGIDHAFALARKHDILILDLRGSYGSDDEVLTSMVGSVFDRDVTIGKKVGRNEEKRWLAKSRGREAFSGHLIVLIDSQSASAAEIFARVVQLEHRGTIVGDHSTGSVMDSAPYMLKESQNLTLYYEVLVSVAKPVMADGQSLEKVGVTPDLTVLPTAADLAAGRDRALARAAELAGVKIDPAANMFPFEWTPD